VPHVLQTPERLVRGLGSAHHGTSHFLCQRLTAILLPPLAAYMFYLCKSSAGQSYLEVKGLFSTPLAFFCTLLFTSLSIFHMCLGMQVVIEDYVSSFRSRLALLVFNKFIALILAFGTLVALLELFFKG
jgi:succinate dehydrogenase / fumarate reductase membrane anchor subunit